MQNGHLILPLHVCPVVHTSLWYWEWWTLKTGAASHLNTPFNDKKMEGKARISYCHILRVLLNTKSKR